MQQRSGLPGNRDGPGSGGLGLLGRIIAPDNEISEKVYSV